MPGVKVEFDYAQVPIEVEKVDLTLFKDNILAAIAQAMEGNEVQA